MAPQQATAAQQVVDLPSGEDWEARNQNSMGGSKDLYGYGSINGPGSFRDDPDVWNDHFRKMSFPHVWNGVPGIMIIISYTT